MEIIYKYKLEYVAGNNIIYMPAGAEILSVGNQHEELFLWAKVDIGAPVEQRIIKCVLTGKITDFVGTTSQFLGTVSFDNGDFVVHCFLCWELPH